MQSTSTRTTLPRPCGRATTPRTIWSDFLGSIPRRISRSTEASNLVKLKSFKSAEASEREYSFSKLYLAKTAFLFLEILGITVQCSVFNVIYPRELYHSQSLPC